MEARALIRRTWPWLLIAWGLATLAFYELLAWLDHTRSREA